MKGKVRGQARAGLSEFDWARRRGRGSSLAPRGASFDSSDRKPYAVKVAVVVAAYYGSAKLGLELAFEYESMTAVWPPTGIALAAVIVWGYRMWPGVALGAVLANTWTGRPPDEVLAITVGNTLEALAGAYLLVDWRTSDRRSSVCATWSRWWVWPPR